MLNWEGKHYLAFRQTYTLAKVSYKTSEFYLFSHVSESHLERIPKTAQQVIAKTNKYVKIQGLEAGMELSGRVFAKVD